MGKYHLGLRVQGSLEFSEVVGLRFFGLGFRTQGLSGPPQTKVCKFMAFMAVIVGLGHYFRRSRDLRRQPFFLRRLALVGFCTFWNAFGGA